MGFWKFFGLFGPSMAQKVGFVHLSDPPMDSKTGCYLGVCNNWTITPPPTPAPPLTGLLELSGKPKPENIPTQI